MLNDQLDEEMKELVKMELAELDEKIEALETTLKLLLVPKDPNDEQKRYYCNLRGSRVVTKPRYLRANLFRMYSRFAEMNNWKVEIMDLITNGAWWFQGNHFHDKWKRSLTN